MNRLISVGDKSGYTMMLKVINALGGRDLNYNWLITDIEAYPQRDKGILDEELCNFCMKKTMFLYLILIY